VAGVDNEHFEIARGLLLKHGPLRSLRTLDALQLSVAIALRRAGYPPVVMASDQRLCRVAELEGFEITDPENPILNIT
jgi:hypothetical protein